MRRFPPAAWSKSLRSPAATSSSLPLQSLAPKEHVPMPSFATSTPFLVVAAVIILVLLIAFVASRYHVAGANEALIVAGSRGAKVRDEKGQTASHPGDKGVKVGVGGGTFIRPVLDRVGKLQLASRQVNVR